MIDLGRCFGLGFKAKIFGLDTGFPTQGLGRGVSGLGFGLVPCGLINITVSRQK